MTEHTFETLAVLTESEIKKAIPIMLRKVGYEPKVEKKFIYAEGNIPIALVAHMDIVGKEPPKKFYYDQNKRIMWAGGHILGADDRAGITAIWEIIKTGEYKPHLIFTCEEETGAAGANTISAKEMPFEDLRYIIELDRQGSDDCVFYECDNKEFETYVNSFGFITDYGTFTDISIICPSWGVAGVNVSVGYYYEHTKYELLNFNELDKTIHRIKEMLSAPLPEKFKYVPAAYVLPYLQYECSFCGKKYSAMNMTEVLLPSAYDAIACPNCIKRNKRIKKCNICGDYFYANDLSKTICIDCEADSFRYAGY